MLSFYNKLIFKASHSEHQVLTGAISAQPMNMTYVQVWDFSQMRNMLKLSMIFLIQPQRSGFDKVKAFSTRKSIGSNSTK